MIAPQPVPVTETTPPFTTSTRSRSSPGHNCMPLNAHRSGHKRFTPRDETAKMRPWYLVQDLSEPLTTGLNQGWMSRRRNHRPSGPHLGHSRCSSCRSGPHLIPIVTRRTCLVGRVLVALMSVDAHRGTTGQGCPAWPEVRTGVHLNVSSHGQATQHGMGETPSLSASW